MLRVLLSGFRREPDLGDHFMRLVEEGGKLMPSLAELVLVRLGGHDAVERQQIEADLSLIWARK